MSTSRFVRVRICRLLSTVLVVLQYPFATICGQALTEKSQSVSTLQLIGVSPNPRLENSSDVAAYSIKGDGKLQRVTGQSIERDSQDPATTATDAIKRVGNFFFIEHPVGFPSQTAVYSVASGKIIGNKHFDKEKLGADPFSHVYLSAPNGDICSVWSVPTARVIVSPEGQPVYPPHSIESVCTKEATELTEQSGVPSVFSLLVSSGDSVAERRDQPIFLRLVGDSLVIHREGLADAPIARITSPLAAEIKPLGPLAVRSLYLRAASERYLILSAIRTDASIHTTSVLIVDRRTTAWRRLEIDGNESTLQLVDDWLLATSIQRTSSNGYCSVHSQDTSESATLSDQQDLDSDTAKTQKIDKTEYTSKSVSSASNRSTLLSAVNSDGDSVDDCFSVSVSEAILYNLSDDRRIVLTKRASEENIIGILDGGIVVLRTDDRIVTRHINGTVLDAPKLLVEDPMVRTIHWVALDKK